MEGLYTQVLADFTYNDRDGKEVKIRKGEELLVVQRSYANWWQAIRSSETNPFYVPSCYLEIIGSASDIHLRHDGNCDENANRESDAKSEDFRDQLLKRNKSDASSTTIQKAIVVSSPLNYPLVFQNPLCDEFEFYHNQDGTQIVSYSEADETPHRYEKELRSGMTLTSVNQESSLPIYANIPFITSASPPTPGPYDTPDRVLPNDWYEFTDKGGRKFYYHSPSKKVTWKPPRRSESFSSSGGENTDSCVTEECEVVPAPPPKQLKPKLKKLAHSSCESLDSATSPSMFTILPQGWTQECDTGSGTVYYSNGASQKKWYTSQDENGRPYFYDENGSESFWELPDVSQLNIEGSKSPDAISFHSLGFDISFDGSADTSLASQNAKSPSLDGSPKLRVKKAPKLPSPRQFKTQSLVISDDTDVANVDEENSFRHGCQIYSGTINRTKLVEGGKRVRKNWASSYVVLTDTFLLFYRDLRTANLIPYAKPDFTIDLAGALIDLCPEKSSRKNVFQISTITGYQLLLQHDDPKEMEKWFNAIHNALLKLPTSLEYGGVKSEEKENSRHEIKLNRSKSTKLSKSSLEDMDVAIPVEKKRKIRDKLKNFFVRRPTMESLREKGIILDEPVFGCLLENLCQRDDQSIPKFVKKCIETIERKELTADGIYRASGNLSQVQKIRYHVNQDDYKCLDEEEDVHVLTGALKMFFREMKKPLFPFYTFKKFLNAIALPDSQQRLIAVRDIVHQMPEPNYETLRFLLCHLLRVTEHHKQNRMQVQNLAIVFGPTLMWPEEESANVALDMMHQNRLVEFLLLEFNAVFKST